jgi:hypothetical protein
MAKFDESIVQNDIDTFLPQVLTYGDRVVGVLRYGAHLPHLWKNDRPAGARVKVILSHMLEFMPPTEFAGKSFILLDDTIYRGRQMRHNVAKLESLGVDPGRIKTAALVVHQESENAPSIPPLRTLPDEDYIRWKSEFAALVRRQRRSTDRDHPLYYFEIKNLNSGALLSAFERFGFVSSVGRGAYDPVYAFSVTIDSGVVRETCLDSMKLQNFPGLHISDVCKIRFYWEQQNESLSLTAVPIVFCGLEFGDFISRGAEVFERLTHVPLSALDYLRQSDAAWRSFVFYLISRSVAGNLLLRFLEDFVPHVNSMDGSIRSLKPEGEDFPVQYIFPPAYEYFHAAVISQIGDVLSVGCLDPAGAMGLAFPWSRHAFEQHEPARSQGCAGLPREYSVLEVLTRHYDPAVFDGQAWVPNHEPAPPLSFKSLLASIGDPILVSTALDELLDSGLLRAKDAPVGPTASHYTRVFLPGGEYNALQVSRIARSCRAPVSCAIAQHKYEFDHWFC